MLEGQSTIRFQNEATGARVFVVCPLLCRFRTEEEVRESVSGRPEPRHHMAVDASERLTSRSKPLCGIHNMHALRNSRSCK